MKVFKKLLLATLIIVAALVVAPQVMPELQMSNSVQAATTVKISKTKLSMNVGETYKLKITGTSKTVKWSSSDKTIASVNSSGKVTAKKSGTVKITAKVGSNKYTCKVKIGDPILNCREKSLKVGKTFQLQVANATQTVKYSSSNKSVATVSSNGKITAKAKGTAWITAKIGKKEITCYVKVENNKYEKNISVTYNKVGTKVIAIFTNKNSCAVDFSPRMAFYDANGNFKSVAADFNYCFEPNSTIAMEFSSYNPATYKSEKFSKYKLNKGIVTKSNYKAGAAKKIKVSAKKKDSYLQATVTNKSGKKLDYIKISVVFYDKNKKVIGYDETYADAANAKGAKGTVSLWYPTDSNYNRIKPASYKVYVNYAYAYNN